MGKSHKIRNDIFNENNNYIHFPFGGVISQEQIIERLKHLKLDKFSEIHLDLYDTDQIELILCENDCENVRKWQSLNFRMKIA